MAVQGNGQGPPQHREDAVGPSAPVAVPAVVTVALVLARPASPNIANMAAPVLAPPVAVVMAPPAGQVIANLAAQAPMILPGGEFDIAGALQVSDPPTKSDMCYKIWKKL